MAAYTFAALFLAHVVADYVLQTTWMVVNKRSAVAMAAHITLVLGAMCLTTLSFQWWFLALTLAHLWIDVVKTYAMREGFAAYVTDQVLHIASIIAVAFAAPYIWETSPVSDIPHMPLIYMVLGGVLFAVRGGQYAVAIGIGARGGVGTKIGVFVGWAERAALCVVLIGGLPALVAGVLAAKGLYLGATMHGRDAEDRRRLLWGTGISLAWGFGVAIPLSMVMPMMQ